MTTTANGNGTGEPLVLVGPERGVSLIHQNTELLRLNFFDGKFLRADDLNREQDYLRRLVWQSNRAGGSGVVHGLTVTLDAAKGTLEVSAGLAVDASGRVLLLPGEATITVMKLLEASRKTEAGGNGNGNGNGKGGGSAPGLPGFGPCTVISASSPAPESTFGVDLYVIAAVHAEALCGEEDVYGKLCEDACVGSTNRRWRLEGVGIVALPLTLPDAACAAGVAWLDARHRRSRVASAYFADEWRRAGGALSGARLLSPVWCAGAGAETGDAVPLGVLAVSGGAGVWIDPWIVRRERMESPPRRYWAGQMMMRPWPVFLAQVLQFQCQLADALSGAPVPMKPEDPCGDQTALLRQVERLLASAPAGEGEEEDGFPARAARLRGEIEALLAQAGTAPGQARILIDRGLVELPAAGYLPVTPGQPDVETQVRALMGPGVDLRICAVRADYVAHALEEAQHMERICLLRGLSDPAARPEVDILVPDGEPGAAQVVARGRYFNAQLDIGAIFGEDDEGDDPRGRLRGAARGEVLPTGGGVFYFAGITAQPVTASTFEFDRRNFRENAPQDDVEMDMRTDELGDAAIAGMARRSLDEEAEAAPAPGLGDALRRMVRRARGEGGVFGMQEASRLQRGMALWSALRADRDPFSLLAGETAAVRAEVALHWFGRTQEARIMGDLTCLSPAGGGSVMRGRLVTYTFNSTPGEDPEPPEEQTSEVELRLQPGTNGGREMIVTMRTARNVFRFTTGWRGSPVQARSVADLDRLATAQHMLLTETDPTRRQQLQESINDMQSGARDSFFRLAELGLLENAAVADATDPAHVLAIRTLKTLETGLQQPGFRDRTERLLFPPAQPARLVPSVRATTDWVLFHRRRRSSCDCCPGAEAPAGTRTYALYHTIEESPDNTVEDMRATISGAVPIDPDTVQFIQQVTVFPGFRGGTAELTTDPQDLIDAWRQVNPGRELVYGAVTGAGAGASDPDGLLEARLDRLGSVVDDVTPAGTAMVLEVLPQIAPEFDPAGTDGVVVLVTRAAPVQTTRHRVLVATNGDMRNRLLEAMTSTAGVGSNWPQFAMSAGFVDFTGAQADETSLQSAVSAAGGAIQSGLPTVTVSPGTVDPLHADQGQVIADALQVEGGIDAQARRLAFNEAVFGGADAISIFVRVEIT